MTEETTPAAHSAPFLSRITLRNFKSVVGQDVSLAPLTLIVGENSSGKSSLFQVVRLMQQAARSKTPGNSFPLNGGSINVGNMEDIRSVQAEYEEVVSMGFDMCIPYSYLDSDYEYHQQNECREGIYPYWSKESKERDDCSFCFHCYSIDEWLKESREDSFTIKWQVGVGAEKSRSTALRNIHFSLTDISGKEREFNIEGIIKQENNSKTINGFVSDYGQTMDDRSQNLTRIYNLKLSGSLPDNVVIQHYFAYRLALILLDGILIRSKDGPSIDHNNGGEGLIESVIKNITESSGFKFPKSISKIPELIEMANKDDKFSPSLVAEIADHFIIEEKTWPHWDSGNHNNPSADEQISPSSLVAKIADHLLIEGKTWLHWDSGAHNVIIAGARYLDKLCDNNIKYLGPLREPPDQPTSRVAIGQTGDIGQSGELTASVLQRFGSEEVLVPTPDGELSEMSLIEAVQEWGRYLGLLQTIRVVQEARLGNTIYVESEGLNKEVPLDAVGVGVSQLLPVLVLCLLSEPGSMILLEQPELHLHPALQQRLADFLIAAVRSGRQLIVETHSEYIVSRLRRRIAEDTSDEDELLSMSKIVFAERDSQTGVTTYREVELSPFGKIEDWPRGFFDQASEEEREIIRSGFRKIADREDRMKETENEDAADV